jgi:hypothetical protein
LRQSSEAASYAAAAVQDFIASLSLARLHRGQPSMIEAGQSYFARRLSKQDDQRHASFAFRQEPSATKLERALDHECIRARHSSGALYRWEFERHGEAMTIDVRGPSRSVSPT